MSLIWYYRNRIIESKYFRQNVRSKPDFPDIVRDFSKQVYEHAYRVLGNVEEAEEATQDVFLRIHRSLHSFRGDAVLSTWIWKITLNVCLTRRERLETMRRRRDPGDILEMHLPGDKSENAHEQVVRREQAEAVGRTISRLPQREATVITMFYLQEMTYAEISEILNIPPGSVATVLHRGRERLRKLLIGQPDEESHEV